MPAVDPSVTGGRLTAPRLAESDLPGGSGVVTLRDKDHRGPTSLGDLHEGVARKG